jgi:4-amino-4-deoxy-L-arabinose transferase-like glycosyltransferase
MFKNLQLSESQYFCTGWALIGLCFVAMLIHLGAHHMFVHTDEPRRAVVALEMILSGNYVVPTLNGEPYLNKPPLLNWLTVSSYLLLGSYSEFAHRLPTIVTLLGLCLVIFFANRAALDNKTALLVMLAVLTNGRVLFLDSFIGMIDIPFALIVYAMFMAVYFLGQAGKYRALFLVTYLLTALAFLTKALPALVFCGFTLLTYFIFFDQWRRLLSLNHLLGILLLGGILGAYYWMYLQASGVDAQTLLQTIFYESSKRTVIRFGIVETLIHLVNFPFNMLVNFAPWSFLALLLFNGNIRSTLWENRFIRYNMLALLANLLVYWSSPEVHPRYLLMHAPLFYTIAISALLVAVQKRPNWARWMMIFLTALSAVFVAGLYYGAFHIASRPQFPTDSPFLPLIWAVIATVVLVAMVRIQSQAVKLLAMAAIMILARFDYSIHMLPVRAYTQEPYRQQAIEIAHKTRGLPLYLYGTNSVQDGTTYYIERERHAILRRHTPQPGDPQAYYLVSEDMLKQQGWQSLGRLTTLFHKDLFLVKLPKE